MARMLWTGTAVLALAAGAGLGQEAGSTATALAERLRLQGYEAIEIKEGPTQTKVTAVRGGEKLEYVFDRLLGTIPSQEVEAAGADDLAVGIEIEREEEDFVAIAGAVMDDHDFEEEDLEEDELDDDDLDEDDEDEEDEHDDEDD